MGRGWPAVVDQGRKLHRQSGRGGRGSRAAGIRRTGTQREGSVVALCGVDQLVRAIEIGAAGAVAVEPLCVDGEAEQRHERGAGARTDQHHAEGTGGPVDGDLSATGGECAEYRYHRYALPERAGLERDGIEDTRRRRESQGAAGSDEASEANE